MSASRALRVPALVAAVALVATAFAMPTASADDLGAPLAARTVKANQALAQAQAALNGEGAEEATIALRDLWAQSDALAPADRARAARLQARPGFDPNSVAKGNIRVHATPEAKAQTSFSASQVAELAWQVSQTYTGAGYRQPRPDCGTASTATCSANRGGDNRTDIYIDTLSPGLYGYCTLDDDAQQPGPGRFDVPAFCVVDNDYAGFPANTPLENLQVTLAHEYFHAVQFAYDVLDDGWFLEATATWAEDEVFDDVNDNVQYLPFGALGKPKNPVTKFVSGGIGHYGQWIFFRYLSEKFPQKQGTMPKIVLDMWNQADSSKGAKKNKYSTQAITKVLKKRKFPVDKAFSYFSDANRRSQSVYDEGGVNTYPVKSLAGKKKLKKFKSKKFGTRLAPWSSATYRFIPKKVKKNFKLKLLVQGAKKAQGTRAVVTTWKSNGKAKQKFVKINFKGQGVLAVPFDTKKVEAVEVTLVNASARFKDCFNNFGGTTWPCYGKPTDKKINISVLGRVIKK